MAQKRMTRSPIFQHDDKPCHWKADCLLDGSSVADQPDDMHLDPIQYALGCTKEAFDGVGRLRVASLSSGTTPTAFRKPKQRRMVVLQVAGLPCQLGTGYVGLSTSQQLRL